MSNPSNPTERAPMQAAESPSRVRTGDKNLRPDQLERAEALRELDAKPSVTALIESARASARVAELDIRRATSAAVGTNGAGAEWIVLYDLIAAQTAIADKLSLLCQLRRENGDSLEQVKANLRGRADSLSQS